MIGCVDFELSVIISPVFWYCMQSVPGIGNVDIRNWLYTIVSSSEQLRVENEKWLQINAIVTIGFRWNINSLNLTKLRTKEIIDIGLHVNFTSGYMHDKWVILKPRGSLGTIFNRFV